MVQVSSEDNQVPQITLKDSWSQTDVKEYKTVQVMAKPPTPPALINSESQTFIDQRDAQIQCQTLQDKPNEKTLVDTKVNKGNTMAEYVVVVEEDKNKDQDTDMVQE